MGNELEDDGLPPSRESFYKMIDTTDLSDHRLCWFLSKVFLDTEIDYREIAWYTRNFPLEHAEKLFFEWVAPVCHVNLMASVPEVWFMFDSDELWSRIHDELEKEKSAAPWRRLKTAVRNAYLRHRYTDDWNRIVSEMSALNSELS